MQTMRDGLIELIQKEVPRPKADALVNSILADGWIRPPCKVGDRLFCVFSDRGINETYNHIETCRVTSVMCFDSDSFVVGVREINRHYSHNVVLGKDAFNTFEEAEAKLKELQK